MAGRQRVAGRLMKHSAMAANPSTAKPLSMPFAKLHNVPCKGSGPSSGLLSSSTSPMTHAGSNSTA